MCRRRCGKASKSKCYTASRIEMSVVTIIIGAPPSTQSSTFQSSSTCLVISGGWREFSRRNNGFRRKRSSTDVICIDSTVRRLQEELGRVSDIRLSMCSTALYKAYECVNHTLSWKVLPRSGVSPQMIKVIGMLHDGARARIQ